MKLFKTLDAIAARLARLEEKVDGLIVHLGAGDEGKNLDTVREAVEA